MAISMQLSKIFCSSFNRLQHLTSKVTFATSLNATISQRNKLFTQEQRRQHDAVGRIEKIEVRYLGLPEDVTFIMNSHISTPFNCAQHLSKDHCKRSVLALIDGNVPWDLHRPLQESCTLQLLYFTVSDTYLVNKAFWRTCSFMLGAALQNSFKTEACLQLHSFPSPNVKSGSFVHDVVLGTKVWKPSIAEMRAISAEMVKLAAQDIQIERLDVHIELALEIFKESRYKREQLPSVAQQNQGRVTLYRMGNHIDISRGPMIATTSFLGKCSVLAAHKIADKEPNNAFYRIQGVALPRDFSLNHFAYSILEERAKKLNPGRLPHEPFEES